MSLVPTLSSLRMPKLKMENATVTVDGMPIEHAEIESIDVVDGGRGLS